MVRNIAVISLLSLFAVFSANAQSLFDEPKPDVDAAKVSADRELKKYMRFAPDEVVKMRSNMDKAMEYLVNNSRTEEIRELEKYNNFLNTNGRRVQNIDMKQVQVFDPNEEKDVRNFFNSFKPSID
ncbi:MAG: hypothetical protein LBR70_04055 [Lactobacillaceae bacterium]|jgi:hypothetical protein|nr:hypothetical protein [Lactobacillaceae bacterium]